MTSNDNDSVVPLSEDNLVPVPVPGGNGTDSVERAVNDAWEYENRGISPEPAPPSSAVGSDGGESMPEGLMDNLDMMDRVLEGKTDVFASKIIQLVMKYHISPNDPVFLILLAMGELELMMVDVPMLIQELSLEHESRLKALFDRYFGSNDAEVERRYNVALTEIQAQIAEAVKELLKSTRQEQLGVDIYTLGKMTLPAMGLLIGAFGFGIAATLQYNKLKTESLFSAGKLSPERYAALQWAESPEGRQAKDIMDFNRGYIGKSCKEDAISKGITLNFGDREVVEGFCLLFIEPPNRRKYK